MARVDALRGVDLDVRDGELLMLVGPSGCGKTTLISIISAMIRWDDGSCEVFGCDLARADPLSREQFRGRTIGFVFQTFNLLPALTACENVAVALLVHGIGRREAMTRARSALDSVGLSERAEVLPGKLSGGQQQRVAIARAIVHEPALIVCDEPTSSLDHETGSDVMEVLSRLVREKGKTLIVVTHDNRIYRFADRIARMDDGRIVETDQQLSEGEKT